MPLLFGCGSLLALTVLGGVLVAALWPQIASFYNSATGTLSELRAVQAALQAKYQTPNVAAMIRQQPGKAPILTLQLINPPFLANTLEEDLPAKAREAAATARDALPTTSTYQHYLVALSRQDGFFIRTGRTFVYTFDLGDLPPRAPHAAPPSR